MEKAYLFGEQKNLLGVLSDPNSSSIDKNLPIIIILNSGLVHHVGPFRMSVDISRILTPLGYRVFRFDLSGIGDSKKRAQDSMLSTERNLSDVGETIEFLKNKYTECKFITLGLCTGADLAHRSAVKYKEVIGTIMLDGYAYPTTRHYLGRYSPMYYIKRLKSILFNPERLKSFIADKKNKLHSEDDNSLNYEGMDAYYWELPEKSQYIQEMEEMSRENKKHLYFFTGGIDYYSYKNQFNDSLKGHSFVNNVNVKYLPDTDHMFTLNRHRDILFEGIIHWLKSI